MEPLSGVIRDYAWGSRTVIAGLQGRSVPSPGPEAELWLGAHPDSPATVRRGGAEVSLLEVLAAAPERWLSPAVITRFGPRLPYLLKVLAAEAPLSLQAHPDAEQARLGHAGEAAGPAREHRNYADPYHKPEMLVALSSFDALCGFRDPDRSAQALAAFGVPALDPLIAALRTGADGLRTAVEALLTWPVGDRGALVGAVAAAEVAAGFEADSRLARQLADRYPGDPGVLVALLLNHVMLAPGEAIWMPAGNLHAYLRGAGVELMAASDNVLRGGLTAKHVDVTELIRVLRFEVLADPILRPVPVAPGVSTWTVPVEDFALSVVRLGDAVSRVRLEPPGPRLVLCVVGPVTVVDGTGAATLAAGAAAIGPAEGGPLTITGTGVAFVASTGISEKS